MPKAQALQGACHQVHPKAFGNAAQIQLRAARLQHAALGRAQLQPLKTHTGAGGLQ